MKMGPEIIFSLIAGTIVLPVVYLVFSRNIIRSAFGLAFSLLALAGLYAFLNAGFMAVVQVLIYAGGIVVLLIFGVMLTRSASKSGVYTDHHFVIPGSVASMVLLFLLVRTLRAFPKPELSEGAPSGITEKVGFLMLTDHLIAFELIAYLLLVVLVGATFLSKKMTE